MIRFRVFLSVSAILLAYEVSAGRLSILEQEVAEKSRAKAEKKKEVKARSYNDSSNSSFGSGTYPSAGGESFLGGFWAWLIASPFQYQHDDPSGSLLQDENEEGWSNGQHSIYPKHVLGQATAPYVRVDYNEQKIDSLTDAQDIRIEVGYKLVAFHGRMTEYKDEDTLDIDQYYGVLRYGGCRPGFLPGTFEFAFGLGVAQIQFEGSNKDSSGALTVPLKYYPTDWFGIEFRPAWYRWMDVNVSDYDLSASVGYRFVQLRGGYRWLGVQGVDIDLNGPYVGMSVSF